MVRGTGLGLLENERHVHFLQALVVRLSKLPALPSHIECSLAHIQHVNTLFLQVQSLFKETELFKFL